MKKQYVFLSHDVDWSFEGPSKEHVFKRKDRFDQKLFSSTPFNKLYHNFPEYMEIEDKFDVKSTFFFRTQYESGDYRDYQKDIKDLINGGWEIGLHSDPSSIDSIEKIKKEKDNLEKLTNSKISGNRVHYLSNDKQLPKKLSELGFVYDSSNRKTKDSITSQDMGYQKIDNIIEFPVTVMDAYLFTYMGISEEKIVPTIEKTLNSCRKLDSDFNIITILWHDNVLKMKGGRVYPKILEFLSSQKDVEMCSGIDLAKKISKSKFL
ncbi:MAG: polysaccharide deacetylase family protein [Nitrosarchaeum sp.]